jgi:hypothetical protein
MKKAVRRRGTVKIELRRETIRHLAETELREVQGGLTSSLGTVCLTICKNCQG